MSAALGHRQTGSVSQNHKAQLASAYNELGKELSSQKIRVIGNYTLGRVIGEGTSVVTLREPALIWHGCSLQGLMAKYAWAPTA